jgi:hypothetical protein
LSRQIKQLEAALGIRLFDRAPRRLHARMLSGLSQKCVIAASATFHFGVPRIGEKFSARERSVMTVAGCDQRGADNRAD